MESEKFESWAIVEIFGHTQIAGKVSEATIAGDRLDSGAAEATAGAGR
jgi:hypothetical protein